MGSDIVKAFRSEAAINILGDEAEKLESLAQGSWRPGLASTLSTLSRTRTA